MRPVSAATVALVLGSAGTTSAAERLRVAYLGAAPGSASAAEVAVLPIEAPGLEARAIVRFQDALDRVFGGIRHDVAAPQRAAYRIHGAIKRIGSAYTFAVAVLGGDDGEVLFEHAGQCAPCTEEEAIEKWRLGAETLERRCFAAPSSAVPARGPAHVLTRWQRALPWVGGVAGAAAVGTGLVLLGASMRPPCQDSPVRPCGDDVAALAVAGAAATLGAISFGAAWAQGFNLVADRRVTPAVWTVEALVHAMAGLGLGASGLVVALGVGRDRVAPAFGYIAAAVGAAAAVNGIAVIVSRDRHAGALAAVGLAARF